VDGVALPLWSPLPPPPSSSSSFGAPFLGAHLAAREPPSARIEVNSSSPPPLPFSFSLCLYAYIYFIYYMLYIYIYVYIYIYIYNSASRVLSAREKGRGGGERRWYESGGEPVGERKEERRGERSQRGH